MTEEKILLYDDPSLVEKKQTTVWAAPGAKQGYSDEHTARWVACTHKRCECGNIHEKNWTRCGACQNKLDKERYDNLLFQGWDGKTPVYSNALDKYFFDADEIDEYVADEEIGPDVELRLVICEPVYLSHIDEDNWVDDLPEEWTIEDVSAELSEMIVAVNKKIAELPPASWRPGKIRTEYTPPPSQ